jgi:hypothetical protein
LTKIVFTSDILLSITLSIDNPGRITVDGMLKKLGILKTVNIWENTEYGIFLSIQSSAYIITQRNYFRLACQ